jgi:exonuclease SbcC
VKPKKLTMSAFCPYSEAVEIDFDAFDGRGLFLITGETGAGKTTIFDGISFALFGEVSGENRGADMLRSDFARPETPTFVRLVFEDRGAIYEIRRNPKYNRPVKRGDSGKTTTQNAEAEILLPNGGIVTGTKEVTEKVNEILGINHRQFKQISMIAQGEFLKLLFADSKERGEIFRKVFGTELYEKIQRELKNQMLGLGKQLEAINTAIIQYNDGIVCEAEDDEYEAYLTLKDNINGLAALMELLERLLVRAQARKQLKSQDVKRLIGQINGKIEQITSGKQLNQWLQNLAEEERHATALDGRAEAITALKAQLELGKKAAYQVKPLHDDWQRLQKQAHDLADSIKKHQEQITADYHIRQERENEGNRLKSQEPQREALATEIETLKKSLPDYERLEKSRAELKNFENERQQAAEKGLKISEALKANKERREVVGEKLNQLKDSEIKKLSLEHEIKNRSEEQQKLGELGSLTRSCRALAKRLRAQQQDYEKNEATYNRSKQQYDRAESLFYAAQAGILAQKLKMNDPCPVCGSREHPNKANLSAVAPSQEKLNQEKKELDNIRRTWQEASIACNNVRTEYATKVEQLKKDVANLQLEMPSKLSELETLLADRKTALEKTSAAAVKELETAREHCHEKQQLEQEQSVLQKRIEQDDATVNAIKATLAQIDIDRAALQTRISGFKQNLNYEDKKTATAMIGQKQAALLEMKQQLEAAQQAYQAICERISMAAALEKEETERLQETKTQLAAAQKALEMRLAACGLADLHDYHEALLTEATLNQSEAAINQHQEALVRVAQAVQSLKQQIDGRAAVDLVALAADQQALEKQQTDIQQELERLGHVIQNNAGIFKALKAKQQERAETERAYSEMKRLSDTANGELRGRQKLPFEQYVQGVYFDMVLAEANKRFGTMTDNRYTLVRKDGGGNNQSKSGLEIDVEDRWTLKRRSVKSLSGGESFKASLSLALGLSDIVQNFAGGVQLDTMFIDEGFGSLDGESLEKAMEILAGLTAGNRLVGIISHLDELKEKIDQKIVISRDPQGSRVELEV